MREAIEEIKMEAAKKPVLFLLKILFLAALLGVGFGSKTYHPLAICMFYAIMGINTTTILIFGDNEIDFFLPRTEKQFIRAKWIKTTLQGVVYTAVLIISYAGMLVTMWKQNVCVLGLKEGFLLLVIGVFSFLQYMILKIGVIGEMYHPADTVHVGDVGFGKELGAELLQKLYLFLSIFYMEYVALADGPQVNSLQNITSKFQGVLRDSWTNRLPVQVCVFCLLTVLMLRDLKRQYVDLSIGDYKE